MSDRADADGDSTGLPARIAASLADRPELPTSIRAVLDYYASTGELAASAVRLQRRVDAFVEGTIDDAFADVEREIAVEAGVNPDAVSFDYDTKLTMPAELTLGHLYQRAAVESPAGYDPVADAPTGRGAIAARLPFGTDAATLRDRASEALASVERAEAVTELVVVALLDGDMRDAINDDEYDDFLVDGAGRIDRSRAAAIAQATLETRVGSLFDRFDDEVRAAYDEAVERSEAHQDRDPRFRELMADAQAGDADALDAIRDEYKFGSFDGAEAPGGDDEDPDGGDDEDPDGGDDEESDSPAIRPAELFLDSELEFPYLKTQYGRVGVIYDGMIEMYRAAGIPIEDAFKRSIVFTIIGAQVWLDDIDDYEADMAETQLTPVTAEYLLADSEAAAYREIVSITDRYLSTAEGYAAATDSPLAGIGTNYVFRSGDPGVLPGSDAAED